MSNRWQPNYYRSKYLANLERLDESKYELVTIQSVTHLVSDGTHFTPTYVDDGVKFLSVKDVQAFEIDYDNSKFITREEADILDRRCRPEKEDILLTKVGTFGRAATIKSSERLQIFVSVALLKPKRSVVASDFLTTYLNTELAYTQFERETKGVGVPDLHLEDIRKVLLPLPPPKIQSSVVEIIQSAYKEKETKEQEAERLLESIDNVVLEALGIDLPAEEEGLEPKVFYARFRNLVEGRFDPKVHSSKLSLDTEKFNMVKFSNCVSINPPLPFDSLDDKLTVSFIPMDAISDEYGEVYKQESRQIEDAQGYTRFQENDLLWAKITPCMENGKSAVAEELINGYGFGSTEFHVFRTSSEEVNIDYLHTLLRLKVLRESAALYFTGAAGHQRVATEFFDELSIPLPPLEVQKELVQRVKDLIQRSKNLREEAELSVHHAKQQVEQMILGEAL